MAINKIINSNQNYTIYFSIVKEIAVFRAMSLFLTFSLSLSAGEIILCYTISYTIKTTSLMHIANNMRVDIMMCSFDSAKETIYCTHSVSSKTRRKIKLSVPPVHIIIS